MSASVVTYCVDTSALIDGLERYYPESSFPSLWVKVDELIDAGRFICSDEVIEEAINKDLPAKVWCQQRGPDAKFCVPTDANVAAAVQVVLGLHPMLVKPGRHRADSFVVAVANMRGACVVTGEGHDGTARKPKIPYVCTQMGIDCIRLTELIGREGWVF